MISRTIGERKNLISIDTCIWCCVLNLFVGTGCLKVLYQNICFLWCQYYIYSRRAWFFTVNWKGWGESDRNLLHSATLAFVWTEWEQPWELLTKTACPPVRIRSFVSRKVRLLNFIIICCLVSANGKYEIKRLYAHIFIIEWTDQQLNING
jgi:hypothetical protein